METEATRSILPMLAFALPIVAAMLTVPARRLSERARDVLLIGTATAVAAAALVLAAGVAGGTVYEMYILQLTPKIWMYMRVDAAGALFGATVAVLWLLALVYSLGYMRGEHRLGRYYSFFILCLAWTMGLAYAGNLLTFLIFYELFSVLTYPLVVHEETPEAMAAGTKYIIYILVGGTLVLLAIVLTFFSAGTQTLASGGILSADTDPMTLQAIFWCFLIGFGVKAAIVPLHGWVPDAHPAAPAPFSAVLSGVMVAAGSFGIIRMIFQVFGVSLLKSLDLAPYLTGFAAFTVLFAAALAVNQENLKRRLAYSTISQMGYVTLAISLLGMQSTIGALVHITNHAFMKGGLFLCAGLFIRRLGAYNVHQLDGAARRMPVTAACFTIASLAMIGTPPLSGFTSKWYLGLGMLETGNPWLLAVLLGGALMAAIYLLPIVYRMYFREPALTPEDLTLTEGREAPMTMLAPLVVATIITIGLGIGASLPGLPVALARMAAQAFFQ
ncbi:MAG: proton-conducting transporter membrane subunit [Coriobacteriia bacterium]|nr:proton-conducting transporter membrane subunit [Coriobacteriia bacterium]